MEVDEAQLEQLTKLCREGRLFELEQWCKDGKPVKTWRMRENCTYITSEPGVYRVEAYIHFRGRRRGWIFSNPIYIR